MKKLSKYLVLFIFSIFASTALLAQPGAPSGKKWVKVDKLSDEFSNGFDDTKWFRSLWDYPGFSGHNPTAMKAKNAGVTNGNLWIRATDDKSKADNERWFESCRVQAKTGIKFPMYTESRIRTAHISAYNTFWLNNGDANDRDEIDIIENNSKPSCGCQPNQPWKMGSQYFLVENGDVENRQNAFDNRNLSANNPLKGKKWNEEFHIFGAHWKDKNTIDLYLDREYAGTLKTTRNFTRDQFIQWDLWTEEANWLGGVANRADLSNSNINTMYIDYVRTFELKDDASNNGAPINQVITLRKTGGNRGYVAAEAANNRLIANRPVARGWERFRIESHPRGGIALKALSNNKYVQVPNTNIQASVRPNGNGKFAWEQFEWRSKGNGKVALKSLHTNRWLQAAWNEDNGVVRARGNSDQGWETFDWQVVSGAKQLTTEIASNDIIVYPNPGNQFIEVKGTSSVDVQVTDIEGKLVSVRVTKSDNSTNSIFIEFELSVGPGVYFIKTEQGKTIRFVKL